MRVLNKIFTGLMILSLFATLSFAANLVLYFRYFYYVQIDTLNIEANTGYTREQIVDAYDDVIDFCIYGGEFSAGELAFSEDGASHFEDCKRLFDLNLWVFIVSITIAVTLTILDKTRVIGLIKPKGYSPSFFAGILGLGIYSFIGIYAALDFDTLFLVFHKIFFPGKTNFYFSPYTDQVINILPERFFLNCAIFIFALIIVVSIGFVLYAVIKRKKYLKYLGIK
ncbi:MAG TPA: TIGR01906 family membrane protein [Clostridia bacterium]|nr:TIGR01906 family membrane protein [Clostridia bacterium]